MFDNDSLSNPDKVVFHAQIITAALIMGSIMFGVIVVVFIAPEVGNTSLLTYVALGLAIIMTSARLIIPNLIVSVTRKRIANNIQKNSDQTMLAEMFITKTIVGAAILEGAAFFTLIAYLVEGQIASLVAACILILLLILNFPTNTSTDQWIEDQVRHIEELRQLAGDRGE